MKKLTTSFSPLPRPPRPPRPPLEEEVNVCNLGFLQTLLLLNCLSPPLSLLRRHHLYLLPCPLLLLSLLASKKLARICSHTITLWIDQLLSTCQPMRRTSRMFNPMDMSRFHPSFTSCLKSCTNRNMRKSCSHVLVMPVHSSHDACPFLSILFVHIHAVESLVCRHRHLIANSASRTRA
jgi:hypothetical protein